MQTEWQPCDHMDRLNGALVEAGLACVIALSAHFLVDRALLGRTSAILDGTATQVALLAWFLWMTFVMGRSGQSWSGKLLGMKVVDPHGQPIGFWSALGRNVFAICISAPVAFLGYLLVAYDPEKQALHDKVFRTFVIRRLPA